MKKQLLTITAILLVVAILSPMAISSAVDARPHAAMPVDYAPVKATVSQLIKKEMKKNDVIGLSIALVDDQQVVWAEGFGYADEKKELIATPETVYRIGSLTNLFTATAVMQLAEQGKLDIDRPLQTYLPEFSVQSRFTSSASITIRALLTHHSGLPSNLLKGMWNGKPEPYTNVVKLIKEEYTAYPPDVIFSYSSVGTTLVGHVVERMSGRSYVSYINESLLHPLGMTHTDFSPAQNMSGSLSRGYHKGRELDEPFLRDVPAGGMQSTVLDLGRFMQMIIANGRSNGNQVLKSETLAEMLKPQNTQIPLDLGLHIGLEWMLSGLGDMDIQGAGIVAHHAGGTLMFQGQMIVIPGHKLGVVVLSNSSNSIQVVNKAAIQAITLALKAKTGIEQPQKKKPIEVEAPLRQEVLREYPGRYASVMGMAEIKPKSDHLHVEAMNRSFQLAPCADEGFSVKYKILGLFPVSLGELDYFEVSHAAIVGHEILKVSTKGRDLLVAEKISAAPVPESWKNRVGEYRIDNPGDDFILLENFHLRYEDGLLLAECGIPFFFKGKARFPLRPVSDTEAVFAGLGRGMGETIKVVRVNGGEALRYSGYLLVKKGE
jgi:CubicO group peptidase (beta-lactamase class C family)